MKIFLLNLICFLFPAYLFAQDLTGLWTGTLVNDSTKKEQHYELALTEYRGKVHGYSYTTFISNDTFYYSIKTLKAIKQDSVWIVEDDEMVANNFPVKPDKGVHQINTFYLNKADSTWNMDGKWHTNKTKRFYSISGTMTMKQEDNLDKSWMIPHLEEMNLAKNIPFYVAKQQARNDETKKQVAVQPKPTVKKENNIQPPKKPVTPVDNSITKKEDIKPEQIISNPEPARQKPAESTIAVDTKKTETLPVKENSVVVNNKPATDKNQPSVSPPKEKPVVKTEVAKQDKPVTQQAVITQTTSPQNKPISKETTVAVNKEVVTKQPPVVEPKKVETAPVTTAIVTKPAEQKKEETKTVPVSIPYTTRKDETTETVYYTSDSLVLSLYDNGVVDGDSVSVVFNGQVILAHQRMSEKAIIKTIYITPDIPDSAELILFADNLGTIPPNTGLLVVRDGDKRYQVHFSADLSKNAAIIFKRKK
jgi:hypothetical protein